MQEGGSWFGFAGFLFEEDSGFWDRSMSVHRSVEAAGGTVMGLMPRALSKFKTKQKTAIYTKSTAEWSARSSGSASLGSNSSLVLN